MNRDQILDTAGSLINGDRARDYGDAAENFQRIADLWCPILGVDVTATDVALCLTQLKVARLITSPGHQDSWVDAAGYVALGGEIASRSAAVDVVQEPAAPAWGYDPAGPRLDHPAFDAETIYPRNTAAMSAANAAGVLAEPSRFDTLYADPQGETVVRGTE
ncbi:hypothetical protein H9623_13150 [Oerskovia sp. Sa1BUA8]|uniref:DUF6378 domain-containing protein n=1 Tax=Oerskovia douganii TaxID=2762210 RepID=A0A9D5YZ08_9CELL|nr:DUF6378 domain-containing protein [Oerskovia douganii]MBE7701243.1 hypothetical protein [Oerskovia douganii]